MSDKNAFWDRSALGKEKTRDGDAYLVQAGVFDFYAAPENWTRLACILGSSESLVIDCPCLQIPWPKEFCLGYPC